MPSAVLLAVVGTIVIADPDRALALPPHLRRAGTDPGADDHRHHLLHHRHRQLRLRPDAEDHPAAAGTAGVGRSRLPLDRRARVFAIVCGLLVAAGLWYAIERTAFGVKLRASVDNAAMAAALGVRTEIIYAVSFAVAVGLAAFGGVVGAELLPVEPYYALRYMVTFLVVVSVGGAGLDPRRALACLLLGAIDTAGRYLMPEYGEFFFYLAVIAIVCVFPRGLAGRRDDAWRMHRQQRPSPATGAKPSPAQRS